MAACAISCPSVRLTGRQGTQAVHRSRICHSGRVTHIIRAAPNEAPPTNTSAPADPAAPSTTPIPEGVKLTTWEYGKTKDPGFAPWFVAMCFLPFLLLLVPLLQSPPPPPVAPGL